MPAMPHLLIALAFAAAPDVQPDTPAKVHPDAQSELPSIEEALSDKTKDPRKEEIRVHTHVLMYWAGVKKKIMKVKMIDAPGRPNCFLGVWDPEIYHANVNKLPVILQIEGKLHFGAAPSGMPRMRWKVREWRGRKYQQERHWRVDRAVYILEPTFKVVQEGVDWGALKDEWVREHTPPAE